MPPPVTDVAIEIRKLRLIILALLLVNFERTKLDKAILQAIEIDNANLP